MDWVYYAVLLTLLLVGLFLNIVGLPGLWVMVAAASGIPSTMAPATLSSRTTSLA